MYGVLWKNTKFINIRLGHIMNKKTDTQVIINNKKYTISGFESDEYIQTIANYINSKYAQFKLTEGYNHLDGDMKNILLEINIADDYFKAKRQVAELENDSESKSNELFDLKHELINAQSKYEASLKEIMQVKDDFTQAQKKIIRMEAEISQLKKQLDSDK